MENIKGSPWIWAEVTEALDWKKRIWFVNYRDWPDAGYPVEEINPGEYVVTLSVGNEVVCHSQAEIEAAVARYRETL